MRRPVALLLLVLFTWEWTGCYSWHEETSPVPKLQSAKPTDAFRVTLANGRVMNLTHVQFRGDTIIATMDSMRIVHGEVERTPVPTSIASREVRLVEHQTVNVGGLVLGVGVGFLFLAGITAAALSDFHLLGDMNWH